MPGLNVAVVGLGVNGLTCAHELSSDAAVTVFHDRDLLDSTSALATAIWHVYLVDPTDTQHLDWSGRTLARLLELRGTESGIDLVEGVELFVDSPPHRPVWADLAVGYQPLTDLELMKFPGRTWGYRVAAPVANMHKYLPWLYQECITKGVRFEYQHIDALESLLEVYDVVVNCAGLRAMSLVADDELHPVRGQYLVLRPEEFIEHAYVGDDEHPQGMAYVIPRDNEILVGGTEEPDEWSLDFVADKQDMLQRASEYWPQNLSALEEIRRVVCLRPCRRSRRVRFGIDEANRAIVHNYGHGGSGFSLSWGCAEDVRRLALETFYKGANQQ